MTLLRQALGPGDPFAAVEVCPRPVNLSADNPIARKLKVAANLTADRCCGGTVILPNDKSDELSVDLVVGQSAAELSSQVASGPAKDPHQRAWRIESCGRRKPVGSRCWRDAQCNSRNSDRQPHLHYAPSPSLEAESFC